MIVVNYNCSRTAPASAEAEDSEQSRLPAARSVSVLACLDAFIVLPRSWLLSALLTLLGLAGGFFLLHLRTRLRERPVPVPDELPLPERIENTRSLAEPPAAVVAKSPAAPTPAPLKLDPSIFRAYDVRGVVGKTLDKDVARALGQSIGTLMGEKGLREIVVGRDGRLSGPELAGALSDGLRAAGIDVIDVGAVPTPVVYYAAYRFNTGCGVAVTGSHNPPDYNGFKIVVGGETLSEGAIQDLYQRIASGALKADGGQGSCGRSTWAGLRRENRLRRACRASPEDRRRLRQRHSRRAGAAGAGRRGLRGDPAVLRCRRQLSRIIIPIRPIRTTWKI
jgi:phosphomannomutase/phosphoglucomutase